MFMRYIFFRISQGWRPLWFIWILDTVLTLLFNMFEFCHCSKVNVSDTDKRKWRYETKLLFVWISFHITDDIVGFVLVCVLNQENNILGSTANSHKSIHYDFNVYQLTFVLYTMLYHNDLNQSAESLRIL